MIWDLTFPKKSPSQEAATLRKISQDPELDPGSTSQDQGPQDPSTSISVHSRILAEDIESDQDWCRYLLKYQNEAVIFYNAGHPVVRWLVLTLYELITEPPLSAELKP
jgi:hypothetical protein